MNIGIDIDGVLTNDDDCLMDTITKYIFENGNLLKFEIDFLQNGVVVSGFLSVYTFPSAMG